jgi:outer membrane protein assembly factor BamA
LKTAHTVLGLIIPGILVLSSCSSTRSLKDGEHLLTKNKITVNGSKSDVATDELHALAKPSPNKKFLGIAPFKLLMYTWGAGGKKETKFRKWLKEKVGERPNLYEPIRSEQSASNMVQYMKKTGFFDASVDFNAGYHGRKEKKARVQYTVTPGIPYTIRNIYYPIGDTLMQSIISSGIAESKIKSGKNFNAFDLDDERDRITDQLLQKGYYFFDRNFIYYDIDSALSCHCLDISVYVKNRPAGMADDSAGALEKAHLRYRINRIFVKTDYDPLVTDFSDQDTIVYQSFASSKLGRTPFNYNLLYTGELRIHPPTVTQSIFIRPGGYYNSTDVRRTRSRFGELGLFNYTAVRFTELPGKIGETGEGILDCHVDLAKRKLHSFTIETEGTNNGGRPGVGFNFSYNNSNIFRGSEILRIQARFSLEAQKPIGGGSDDSDPDVPFFNTVETGLDLSVDFPRFLIPIRQDRFPRYFRPKTTVRLGISYEQRPEYDRQFTGLSFGYEWKESDTKRHILFPFDWSYINVHNSPEFQEQIDQEPNDRIRSQYTDHLIFAIRYSFVFNNQDIRRLRNFFYFRGNLELAGNIPYAFQTAFGGKSDSTGNYTIFGIRYSQYVRLDFDMRYYNVITRNNTIVYRLVLGGGIPYGNGEVLPLEKGFYGGGANGMRGWTLRLLGPGSYSNPEDNFDRMGDIQIEGNFEYRFPVYKFFKAALFADIGNIWLLEDNESYPGGKFRFDSFYRELAIDAGLGVRLDFNFFILRVDMAAPIRDPARPEDDRWVFDKLQFNDFLINFGIGYPF